MARQVMRTRTGKKIHYGWNGSFTRCGLFAKDMEVISSGELSKFDVCQNCFQGMEPNQFKLKGITFK